MISGSPPALTMSTYTGAVKPTAPVAWPGAAVPKETAAAAAQATAAAMPRRRRREGWRVLNVDTSGKFGPLVKRDRACAGRVASDLRRAGPLLRFRAAMPFPIDRPRRLRRTPA